MAPFNRAQSFMTLVILLDKISKRRGIVSPSYGIALLIEKDKILVTVNHYRLYVLALCHHLLKCLVGFLTHWHLTHSAFGLWCFNVITDFLIP